MRTPVSYYGGKAKMLPHILPLIPAHQVYTEVFFGGGAVFFAKGSARQETINDHSDLVVNFYQVARDPRLFRKLQREINKTLIARTIHKRAQKHIKRFARRKRKRLDVMAAWAFWYAANFSHSNKIGGGLKYSNDMHTNVPKTLNRRKQEFTETILLHHRRASLPWRKKKRKRE
jgi:DNA adenine methylase